MNRFSHFKWYELLLYAVFCLYCLKMIVDGMSIFDSMPVSPLIPIYAKFLSFVPTLVEMIIGLISIQGMIYLIAQKKGGWTMLFFGSLTLALLSFVPFHGLPYEHTFGGNYFALIFLSVPLVLFLRRTSYNISSMNSVIVFAAVFFALFLEFFSFNIFMLFQ